MTCDFHVGQKVVCVDASCGAGFDLREGATYTVSAVGYESEYWVEVTSGRVVAVAGNPVLSLSVSEVTLRHSTYGAPHEPQPMFQFMASRFRPVVESGTETGMSILRNLLNKTGKRVEVDA